MDKNYLFRQIVCWGLAGMIAMVISSIAVMGYNWSGTHVSNPTGSTCYKWKPNQYKADATEGINYMHMDSNGFNNISSDIENVDILLMGGSHMEAIQFPTKNNTASLLNVNLPELYTYNIGMSGHQLLDCLDNIENAYKEFTPSKYVIIQTGDLKLNYEDVVSVQQGVYADIPSYDSGVVYYLQMIPSLKVIYKQINNKLTIDRKKHSDSSIETVAEDAQLSTNLIESVLSDVLKAKRSCLKEDCKLIIVYTPAIKILPTGKIERDDDINWVNKVRNCCEIADVIFLDCYSGFLKEFNSSYAVPFGFANSKIGTGHLNETGHRILAGVLAEYIMGENR